MKSFFLTVIKQIFSFIIAGILTLSLLIILALILIGTITKAPVLIPKDSILVIDLGMSISDAQKEKNFSNYLNDYFDEQHSASLLDILDAIENASTDSRIKGILLKNSDFYSNQNAGFPVLHEIRNAIENFKTNKPVIAYFVDASLKDYFIGSVANQIILNPLGQLSLKGLSVETTFFADAFEKYGIGIQITQSGKYKTSVEPYVMNHMSDFDREQVTTLLQDIWNQILQIVSNNRNINQNELKNLSETTGIFLASEAKDHNLIDAIEYEDQVFTHFKLEVKPNNLDDHKIALTKYIKDVENKKTLKNVTKHASQIAIVYVEGEIFEGESGSFQASADHLERNLDTLTNDDQVKAVVLRVNSPGGGAHAAEKILRATQLLQIKKPLVASFGTYAASGGYWISCFANNIFLDPMTITGSIGVFSLLPNIEKIANNHGVNFEFVSTAPFATINSFAKPRTQTEMAKLQNHTDFLYKLFLNRVSNGRKLPLQEVENLADGKVWSGLKAKTLGLANDYGGLKDAIQYAAKIAHLDHWEVIHSPHKDKFSYNIFHLMQEKTCNKLLPNFLKNPTFNLIQKQLNSNFPNDSYAQMPFYLSIH